MSGSSAGVIWRRAGSVHMDLENLPSIMAADGGEHQFVRVVVEVHIAHEVLLGGLVNRLGPRVVGVDGQLDDLVFNAGVDTGVPLPVLGQSKIPLVPLDQQNGLEVQQRVGQQRFALQLAEPVQRREGGGISGLERGAQRREFTLEGIDRLAIVLPVRVAIGIGATEIVHRPAQGRDVEGT